MKSTLEFTLPEEQSEFELAMQGASLLCVLINMVNFIRGKLKYGYEYTSITEALEDIQRELHEEILSNHVDNLL